MSSKKRITTAVNKKEAVARIAALVGDPTTVLVTGLDSGSTTVTLTDEAGKNEEYEIIVQLDVEYLKTILQRTVPTASIEPIPVGNSTIILRGNVAHAEDIDGILRSAQSVVGGALIINQLRVGGVQQVQLDVVVAQVSRSDARRIAFDFTASGRDFFLFNTTSGAAGPAGTVGIGNTNGGITGTAGSPNGAGTNISFGVLHAGSGFLSFLQALRDESVLKLMAEPRLVTLSGKAASFLSGGEQAVPVPAGLGQVGVQFEEFGTRLNFLPIVLGNGKIHLEVEPEVSNLNAAFGTSVNGTVVPGRDTQRVHTTVQLEDGQTFVIGGLIQKNTTATTRKFPILGDLPFVGAAFRGSSFVETENELVILVTPHLIDAMSCDQLPKYLPGQESRRVDDFELFLEGILEAPRGQREVFPCNHYMPAYKNGPTAGLYPCGLNGGCGAGCTSGNCAGSATSAMPMATGTSMAPAMIDARAAQPMPASVLPAVARPDILPLMLSGTQRSDGSR